MTEESLCRTCAIPAPRLLPLFPRPERKRRYALALEIATGLQIEMNDGLPQHICTTCSKSINKLLRFRRNSQRAQKRLIELGFRRKTSLVCFTEQPPCTVTSEEMVKDEIPDFISTTPKSIDSGDDFNDRFQSNDSDSRLNVDALSKDNFDSLIKDNFDSLTKDNIDFLTKNNLDSVANNSLAKQNLDAVTKHNFDSTSNGFDSTTNDVNLTKTCDFDNIAETEEIYASTKVEVEIADTKYEPTVPIFKEKEEDSLTRKLKENVPMHLLWRIKPPKNKLVLDKFLNRSAPLYTCNVCRKLYKQTGSFVDHTLIHTGFEFMCEQCGKVFRNAAKLLRHQRSVHGAARDSKLQCPHCAFRALDTVRLKEHIRTHTGERPYMCDACGSGFTGRELLIQHLTVHITERTVQCDQCPAKFRTRKCLNTHRSKRHKPRLWRYQCAYCPNVYSVFNNCRCHASKVHGVPHALQKQPLRVPVQL